MKDEESRWVYVDGFFNICRVPVKFSIHHFYTDDDDAIKCFEQRRIVRYKIKKWITAHEYYVVVHYKTNNDELEKRVSLDFIVQTTSDIAQYEVKRMLLTGRDCTNLSEFGYYVWR